MNLMCFVDTEEKLYSHCQFFQKKLAFDHRLYPVILMERKDSENSITF